MQVLLLYKCIAIDILSANKCIMKKIFKAEIFSKRRQPHYLCSVKAGFPSPADDYAEKPLDINDIIIKHPSATYYVKASGDSMKNAGIFSGDILVVDRSISPSDGKIIIAVINGEMTVKRLHTGSGVKLVPENDNYPTIEITEEMQFEIWGVVTYVVHRAE